jgi:hypothetical protein
MKYVRRTENTAFVQKVVGRCPGNYVKLLCKKVGVKQAPTLSVVLQDLQIIFR